MKIFGVWANLMSLGAIDFGIIVDGAVIIVEGIVFEIERRISRQKAVLNRAEMDKISYEAASTMMHSCVFWTAHYPHRVYTNIVPCWCKWENVRTYGLYVLVRCTRSAHSLPNLCTNGIFFIDETSSKC